MEFFSFGNLTEEVEFEKKKSLMLRNREKFVLYIQYNTELKENTQFNLIRTVVRPKDLDELSRGPCIPQCHLVRRRVVCRLLCVSQTSVVFTRELAISMPTGMFKPPAYLLHSADG